MASKFRAYWKGYLRLSLVTIGIEVYNGVESKSSISFRQIHKPSGRRVRYEKVAEGVGPIESADIVKGYEVDHDTFVVMEPEEIDALKLDSKKTIDLIQFIDATEIDYRYFERPYFVTPSDALGAEGYIVIRDALRKTGKVGLAQVTIAGREWLVAIAPVGDGLLMELLRYAEELRDPADFFGDLPDEEPSKEMIDLAVQLIEKKSATFDPDKFHDRYQEALKALVQEKMKGRKIVAPEERERPRGDNVVDLMEALKRSVGQATKSGKRQSSGSHKASSASSKSTGRGRR
ncbi:MAG: Ku protein [Hyphomicrobiaceae bacterium]